MDDESNVLYYGLPVKLTNLYQNSKETMGLDPEAMKLIQLPGDQPTRRGVRLSLYVLYQWFRDGHF